MHFWPRLRLSILLCRLTYQWVKGQLKVHETIWVWRANRMRKGTNCLSLLGRLMLSLLPYESSTEHQNCNIRSNDNWTGDASTSQKMRFDQQSEYSHQWCRCFPFFPKKFGQKNPSFHRYHRLHLSLHLTEVGGFYAHPFPVQSCSSWRKRLGCWSCRIFHVSVIPFLLFSGCIEKSKTLLEILIYLRLFTQGFWWSPSTFEVGAEQLRKSSFCGASEGFTMALAAKMRFAEGTTAAAHRQEPTGGKQK